MLKKVLFVKLFTLISFSLFAHGMNEDDFFTVNLGEWNSMDISDVDKSSVQIRLDYPGYISGNCAVKLDTTVSMTELLKNFNFNKEPVEVSEKSATYNFRRNLYVDYITFEVISGKSLKSVLSELGASLRVSVVPCEDNNG